MSRASSLKKMNMIARENIFLLNFSSKCYKKRKYYYILCGLLGFFTILSPSFRDPKMNEQYCVMVVSAIMKIKFTTITLLAFEETNSI